MQWLNSSQNRSQRRTSFDSVYILIPAWFDTHIRFAKLNTHSDAAQLACVFDELNPWEDAVLDESWSELEQIRTEKMKVFATTLRMPP